MCGIAGVLRIHDLADGAPPPINQSIPEAWLDILDVSLIHRGPDGQGRFRDRATRADGTIVDVAFVHRRLSVIDHADGGQPMVHGGEASLFGPTAPSDAPPSGPDDYIRASTHICSQCESHSPGLIAVAFNGCIYNHRKIRCELELEGHTFASDHSDTEVFLHAWRAWGEDAWDHLDGMYAAAIWDGSTGELHHGRDRFGEKPLYVTQEDGVVAFASVAGAISRLLPATRRVRSVVPTASWLMFGYGGLGAYATPVGVHSSPRRNPHAIELNEFKGVCDHESPRYSAQEQRAIKRDLKRIDKRQHYLQRTAPLHQMSEAQRADAIESLVSDAVASRLEADVPIACFLSGGVDSSLVAHFAKRHAGAVSTISVRMPDARYDESEHAKTAADAIGADHRTIDVAPDPAGDLVSLIHTLGLPFGDSSLLPTFWVSKAAASTFKVVLSGDGGDELFYGYQRYAAMRRAGTALLANCLALLGLLPRRDPTSKWDKLARLAASGGANYPSLLAVFQWPDAAKLLRWTRGDHRFALLDSWPLYENLFDPVYAARAHDLDHYLPDDLMRKVDTASMHVALEVRAPLLATELTEAVRFLSFRDLCPGATPKGLLKQIARKHLPASIIDRPKMGFAIPIGEWFRSDYGGMRQLLHDHLESADPFPNLPIEISMSFVRRMLREHDAAGERSIDPWRGRDHAQRLYMLLVLSIWAKWLDGLS